MAAQFVTLIVAAAIMCLGTANAAAVDCKGVDIEVAESHMMDVNECLKVVKLASVKELTPQNAGCFVRCVMESKGLIDSAYKPHKENINKIIDDTIPKSFADQWKGEMGKCLDNEGNQLKSATDDPQCMSFLPLSMCMHMAFMKVCKS